MNNTPTRITGKEPDEAIELDNVYQGEKHHNIPVGLGEKRLPCFVKDRYLYASGEDEGGEKRRATDRIWSLKMFDLKRSVVTTGQPVLYYLSAAAPKRGFVREELQVVPEDSELPPANILKWPYAKVSIF